MAATTAKEDSQSDNPQLAPADSDLALDPRRTVMDRSVWLTRCRQNRTHARQARIRKTACQSVQLQSEKRQVAGRQAPIEFTRRGS